MEMIDRSEDGGEMREVEEESGGGTKENKEMDEGR